ncbi:ROK family protein [Paenibacillus sp. PCH8]|uniref:ROK family protein n=1 Tax=Paenibacillus sp. PCH8 TaxID=2066524 RepID=UPI000CF87434|nr:ROK family protein [Paenibacillus sp. PCH8]PQP81149.1 ROK family protein [Paenibacillus sp. PCH8]
MTEFVNSASNDLQFNQVKTVSDTSNWIAGIDIGGTKTLIMLSSQRADSEVHECRLPTLASDQPDEFFRWLFAELDTFCREVGCSLDQLSGAGLGFPGVILQEEGILRNAPAFQWPEQDIRPIIAKYYNGNIILDNDVNLAAMGEYDQGAAHGHRHCVMVTVGTGIGAALVLNGQLYSGQNGAAGEIGHFITGDEGLQPGYIADADAFGVFEQVTSGTGITEQARRYFADGKGSSLSLIMSLAGGEAEQIEARHVFKAAESGDVAALEILELPMRYMARGLANITALLNPSIIVIGGGVAASNPTYYLNEVRTRLERYTVLPTRLAVAELGNKAGAIGALAAIRSI